MKFNDNSKVSPYPALPASSFQLISFTSQKTCFVSFCQAKPVTQGQFQVSATVERERLGGSWEGVKPTSATVPDSGYSRTGTSDNTDPPDCQPIYIWTIICTRTVQNR